MTDTLVPATTLVRSRHRECLSAPVLSTYRAGPQFPGGNRCTGRLVHLENAFPTTGEHVKIGIIIGSTRPGRLGSSVGKWVLDEALAHGGAEFELIELADYALALLNSPTVPVPPNSAIADPQVRNRGQKKYTKHG